MNFSNLWGAAAPADPGTGNEALAAQVKEMQRHDNNAKMQWIAYTDVQGGGTRDPAKHDFAFLQAFLAQLATGGGMQTSQSQVGSESATCMVDTVKMLRKRSSKFQQAWIGFCQEHGGGTCDPSRHGVDFHGKFFETIVTGVSPMGMGLSGSPMKRMRDSSGMGVGTMFGGGGGTGDRVKDALVHQVKSFQRMGPDQKDLWSTYVDTYYNGLRDPSRHETSTLQEFCTNHGVPPAGAGGGGAGMGGGAVGVGGPEQAALVQRVKAFQRSGTAEKELWGSYVDLNHGGLRDPSRHSSSMLLEFCLKHGVPENFGSGSPAGMAFGFGGQMGGSPMVTDPEKLGLVERVKTFQKASPECKEMWNQFCGATKDPARHEAMKLQEFCTQVGI